MKRFFEFVNAQLPMLDPTLHTPAFVQQRSAFLFTVILCLGATSLATAADAPESMVDTAEKLEAHAAKLHLVVCATGAKSIDIIQGELVRPLPLPLSPHLQSAGC